MDIDKNWNLKLNKKKINIFLDLSFTLISTLATASEATSIQTITQKIGI